MFSRISAIKRTVIILFIYLLPLIVFSWFGFSVVYDKPSWAPDNNRLVFEKNSLNPEGYNGYDILIKSLDGKIDRPLTMWCDNINFSPDYRFVIINDEYLMELNSPNDLTDYMKGHNFMENGSMRRTAWSPEGDKIAFVIYNYRNATSAIGIYDLKTDKRRLIVKDRYAYDNDDNDFLLWRGNRIIYTSAKKPGQTEPEEYIIRSVSTEGRDSKILPHMKKTSDPNSSEDKVLTRHGLFRIVDDGRGADESEQTAGKSLVLKDKDGVEHMIMPANGSNPVWSPVDDLIAFDCLRKDGKNVWIYDVGKGAYTQITFQGGTEPRWSKDGGKIVFKRGKQSYVIGADGTNIRKMKESEKSDFMKPYDNRHGAKSPNGKYTVYNKPGVTKNYESYEWSTLVVKDEFGRETVIGERIANF